MKALLATLTLALPAAAVSTMDNEAFIRDVSSRRAVTHAAVVRATGNPMPTSSRAVTALSHEVVQNLIATYSAAKKAYDHDLALLADPDHPASSSVEWLEGWVLKAESFYRAARAMEEHQRMALMIAAHDTRPGAADALMGEATMSSLRLAAAEADLAFAQACLAGALQRGN